MLLQKFRKSRQCFVYWVCRGDRWKKCRFFGSGYDSLWGQFYFYEIEIRNYKKVSCYMVVISHNVAIGGYEVDDVSCLYHSCLGGKR